MVKFNRTWNPLSLLKLLVFVCGNVWDYDSFRFHPHSDKRSAVCCCMVLVETACVESIPITETVFTLCWHDVETQEIPNPFPCLQKPFISPCQVNPVRTVACYLFMTNFNIIVSYPPWSMWVLLSSGFVTKIVRFLSVSCALNALLTLPSLISSS